MQSFHVAGKLSRSGNCLAQWPGASESKDKIELHRAGEVVAQASLSSWLHDLPRATVCFALLRLDPLTWLSVWPIEKLRPFNQLKQAV